jgi:Protein of unknown function (DUF4245)
VTETPTAPEDSAAPTTRPRGRESVGDMVRSLSLVLVVVAVVFLLTLRDEPKEKVQRVDYSQELQAARRAATYDVVAPVNLGDRWKATSARGDNEGGAVTWHIGFVTPDDRYAAIEQSDGPASAFIDDFVEGATKAGTAQVSGAPWQRLDGGKPEARALVLRGSGVTTLVTGSASFTELRQLAAALRGG